MKLLNYIYTLLIAMLLGIFSFACSDDDVEQTEGKDSTEVYGGDPITTTVKVCVSAPDVSVDIESATRADNANIEYAQPENGGRFQNIVVVVTDNSDNVYAIHCNKWYDGAPTSTGVKQYEVIFPDLKINTTEGRVYALGNVSTDVYNTISGYTVSGTTAMSNYTEINNLIKTSNISVTTANLYKLSFKPQAGNFKVGSTDVTTACSGMPVNAVATATIQKGATVFDVKMRRVCARLQVTFRNFTGQYIVYETNTPKDNNVYVDQFVINRVLATSSKYFYDGSAPSNTGSEPFNILDALGGTNDHDINKIENGKELVASMYVFENKKGTVTGAYTYNLKVDRGKSLGNQVAELQNDNVYVVWSDNLDTGSGYDNSVNTCLGSDGGNIKLVSMSSPDIIPYGTETYGNRVFWHYNGGKFQNCNVNLLTDVCTLRGGYINKRNYGNLYTSGTTFEPEYKTFEGFNRYRIYIDWGVNYLIISNDKLQSRIFLLFRNEKSYYPWVFFAKYIIKTNQNLNITKIERNHSYELEFKVMPNYEKKQELLVNCVRRQNDIDWSETQK
ncbi:MAG: hypothetical protein KIH03_12070 [Paludibacteraceae bacterium]|nr:hypothetical protein [Paludibacteraceae bacterium]